MRPEAFCSRSSACCWTGFSYSLPALRRLHAAQLAAGAQREPLRACGEPLCALPRRWRSAAAQRWLGASRRAVASAPGSCARIAPEVRVAWLCTRRLTDPRSAATDARSVRMSSRDLSRVLALTQKVAELHRKEHHARAVEKSAAAISAAQELAQEDCLVVVHLQLLHITALNEHAQTPGLAVEALSQALYQPLEMVLAVIEALERRRAAGTLLAGACRSWPEEEWYGEYLQRREALNRQEPYTPEELALLVKLVGYDAYLMAAAAATNAMMVTLFYELPCVEPFARFILGAIDLFEQPRLKLWKDFSLASENMVTVTMQQFCKSHGPRIAARDALLPPILAECTLVGSALCAPTCCTSVMSLQAWR